MLADAGPGIIRDTEMEPVANSNACFSATHWSVILTAAKAVEPGGHQALEQLCRQYWYPIYAFLRRKGRSPHDAEDLTQGFFADLLSRNWLADVGPEKGKFRTFLLACLCNYVGHVHDRETGPTRQPGRPLISIDAQAAEARYALEPADLRDPAALFERRWAYALIDDVLQELRQRYVTDGKAALFDALSEHLIDRAESGSYVEIAAKLGMTEGAVRVAVSRLRDRFRELLIAEVTRTVRDARDAEQELRHLFVVSQH